MTRKLLFFLTAATVTFGAGAELLTPEQALKRAGNFSGARKAGINGPAMKLVHSAFEKSGQPALYVFENSSNEGFTVLSADDVAAPVLAYSDHGTFDMAESNPSFRYWLDFYAEQIEFARENGITGTYEYTVPAGRKEIHPLVKTRWNQTAPYNDLTPRIGGVATPTGCVATAMAQVMKYWAYPVKGTGSNSYNCQNVGVLSMNFENTTFDWQNMLNAYSEGRYTNEEALAVATLMKAAGYAAEMKYSTSASGTQSARIGYALKKYFGYDGNITFRERMAYSSSEWDKMVYDQLSNIGPMIYDGSSDYGGHSFVCDGYDGNGYYHFNWGWGGLSDGYFSLNALCPSTQGVGGNGGYSFNFSQDGVFGIQPPTGKPVAAQPVRISMYGTLTASVRGSMISFGLSDWKVPGWGNGNAEQMSAQLGVYIEPIDGTPGNPSYMNISNSGKMTLDPGTYYMANTISPSFMFPSSYGAGKYKVSIVCKDLKQNDPQWLSPIYPYGYRDYVIINKTSGGYTVEAQPIDNLKITSAEFESDVYYSYPARLKFTVTNPSSLELTKGIAPVLIKGTNVAFEGDNTLITVAPGETVTKELVTTFITKDNSAVPAVSGSETFSLQIIDPQTNESFGHFSIVTMKRTNSSLSIKPSGIGIYDAETGNDEAGFRYFKVTDPRNIKAYVKFNVTTGYFASPIIAVIDKIDVNDIEYAESVLDTEVNDAVFAPAGTKEELDATIDFSDADKDGYYSLTFYYIDYAYNVRVRIASTRFLTLSSSVAGLENDGNDIKVTNHGGFVVINASENVKNVNVIDATGKTTGAEILFNGDNATADLSGMSRGLYLLNVTTESGKTKSVKIMR